MAIELGSVNTQNSLHWDHFFESLAKECQNPFFSSKYYSACQNDKSEIAECFWAYQDESNFLFYPYLINRIDSLGYDLEDDYYDVCGAYGYNGPIGKATNPKFLQTFNQELQAHFVEHKVVTELVRYCPLVDNRKFHTYTDQIHVLDNVYIDLSQGLDYVWNQSFEYRVRKSIRKGESYGLRTIIKPGSEIAADDLEVFYQIYTSTMDRNEAEGFYYFDLVFFEQIVKHMGDIALLATTYLGDIPITTELLFVGGELAYGFLGGTLGEYYNYKANTFQRWELIKYLTDVVVKKYSMGGGAKRGDSIFAFKMSFAKGCKNPFFIGTKVHLPEVYTEILSQWQSKHPLAAEKYKGKLQGYRHTS